MKRLWFGLAILAVLLASGYLILNRLDKIHAPIAADLEQAAAAALREDWDTALDLAQHATIRWEKFHRFTAAFADHTPMDELDSLFAELNIYARMQENPHFSATCAHLRFLTTTIADSHRLTWQNLL
jgi:hypothetical protein